MRAQASIVLTLWVGCLLGCGYSFAPYRGGEVSAQVAIKTLVNNSFEPGVDGVMQDALYREFLRRGVFGLVESDDAADLVLSGEIAPLRTRSRSFSTVKLALEYEVTLELELQVNDGGEEPLALDERLLQESEFYLASADVEVLRRNRSEAVRRLTRQLASRVHDVLYEHVRR